MPTTIFAQDAERFRSLYERTHLAVYVHDFGGRFLDANEAALEMLGFTREELLDVTFSRLLDEAQLPLAMATALELFETGSQKQRTQFRLRRKDGSFVWVETEASVLYDGGRPFAVQGLARDMTDRVRAEEKLRESEARYRMLADHVSDVIWTMDLNLRFTYLSPSELAMTGYTLEEALELGAEDVLVPASLARARAVLSEELALEHQQDSFDPTRCVVLELEQIRKDGSICPTEATITWLRDERGHPVGLLGVTRDISERKRAEVERCQAEARVQDARRCESLGVLAGGIAHDFNNLLQVVLGNAEIVVNNLPEDWKLRPCLDDIVASARRAAELADHMLAYSGRCAIMVKPTQVGEVLPRMVEKLREDLHPNTTLALSIEPGLPSIQVDLERLKQVVSTLVANASEAIGDAPGRICVSAGVTELAQEDLAELAPTGDVQPGQFLFLEVSDTGCGMDPETQVRVFDPFFSTKQTGRGLGLASVWGIVRGHRGTISLSSEPNQGTRVRVGFPAISSHPKPFTATAGRGCNAVLVVDDEPSVRLVTQRMLERMGLRVLTARDGEEGIAVFEQHADEIGCVLLDLTMPRMGGREALAHMRRIRSHVPIILCSGFAEQAVGEILADQCAAFLHKPFGLSELERVVRLHVVGERAD